MTHQVINQVPPLTDYNLFSSDTVLQEAVLREGASWDMASLTELGARFGSEEVLDWGVAANRYPPELKPFDNGGHRIDKVSYHPAWHELLTLSKSNGLHSLPWQKPQVGAHVARAARYFMMGQIEAGHGCPITMTYASIPALRVEPKLADKWESKITSFTYDQHDIPAADKSGLLCGMAMTEKQGGSDVRANSSTATPVSQAGSGEWYRLTGHKWFCSAPMCDFFFMLAQAPSGLSCFLVPRWLPDGSKNPIHIQRLKDKLGNRSNASSEIEFENIHGLLVGDEGRGVATIIKMVNYTRLDCVIGSSSLLKQATTQAYYHTSIRQAFGDKLINQPLMKNVLADMALEGEAATTLLMRLAKSYDEGEAGDKQEQAFARIATAISKYWVCKRVPTVVFEAMECLGGHGYVEEQIMPRLYREAPLNSIWEGSGNVNALDVLRVMDKSPECVEALMTECQSVSGQNASYDMALTKFGKWLSNLESPQVQARTMTEQMCLLLQGSLLLRYAPSEVSDTFCDSRLGQQHGVALGTLSAKTDFDAIIGRATPKL